jgi:hypothetical protein
MLMMFDDAHNPESSAPPDWRIARMEGRLRRLGHALDRGTENLDLATRRARVVTEAMEAGAEPPKGVDPGEAFERVFRGVRYAIVLEAKLDDDLFAMQAGTYVPEPRRAPRGPRSGDPTSLEAESGPDRMERRDQLHGSVLELAHPMGMEPMESERLYANLHENLYESERYDALLDLPVDQAVAVICKDLDVIPQYDRWEGMDWPPWRAGKPAAESSTAPPTPPPAPLTGGEPAREPELEEVSVTAGPPPWPPP